MNTGAAVYESHGRKRFVRFGHPGMSDILAIAPTTGKLIALEIKIPGKKPTPAQAEFLAIVNAAGGIGRCITSVDEAQALLDTLLPTR